MLGLFYGIGLAGALIVGAIKNNANDTISRKEFWDEKTKTYIDDHGKIRNAKGHLCYINYGLSGGSPYVKDLKTGEMFYYDIEREIAKENEEFERRKRNLERAKDSDLVSLTYRELGIYQNSDKIIYRDKITNKKVLICRMCFNPESLYKRGILKRACKCGVYPGFYFDFIVDVETQEPIRFTRRTRYIENKYKEDGLVYITEDFVFEEYKKIVSVNKYYKKIPKTTTEAMIYLDEIFTIPFPYEDIRRNEVRLTTIKDIKLYPEYIYFHEDMNDLRINGDPEKEKERYKKLYNEQYDDNWGKRYSVSSNDNRNLNI